MEGGCSSSEPFALRVLGDSMEPEFNDGCIVVVDPTGVVESGCYVIAMHEGEYIFRQLILENDRLFLTALNEGYEHLEIPSMAAIKGVITQRAGRHRKDRKHYG